MMDDERLFTLLFIGGPLVILFVMAVAVVVS